MKLFVDAKSSKQGDGSRENPFKCINDAAKVAAPGDEILVMPGIYRENVCPVRAGLPDAPIVYKSVEPLGAVITGAEPAKNWELYQDTVWRMSVDNGIFADYNPYTTFIYGDWYMGSKIYHTGVVYLDDRQMYEVSSLEECIKAEVYPYSWEPEYSRYKWYTEQKENKTIIYANFLGKNPNEENVEINVRRNCFMPVQNGIDYITVQGFNINKAAPTWAPPAAYQDGMIGPHWSKGWIIEDCDISNSRCSGISLGKYYDEENDHYFTKNHVKSPTQMERDAVCRGQYHGWTKEKIGSHIIRRNNIHHCEQAGIVGRMGCVFSVVENNNIHHINNMQQLIGAELAAIKFHAAIDVVIRNNNIHHSTMGIWLDWEAQGTRISGNLFHHNNAPSEDTPLMFGAMMCQDVFVEVSHGPTLIDNNIMLSQTSVRIASQGVALVHNLFLGALTGIGGGTDNIANGVIERRYTPYHIRHETEVAGFMTILHGDDRIYNNIFVQNEPVKEAEVTEDMGFTTVNNNICGTEIFDSFLNYQTWIDQFDMEHLPDMTALQDYHFRSLPVWINGNVYLNGARSWKLEKDKFVDHTHKVTVELIEEGNQYRLKTNLAQVLKDYTTGMICTQTLGKALEPDEYFENPDGTPIIFDRDYFSEHRSINVIPGPFADLAKAEDGLWY